MPFRTFSTVRFGDVDNAGIVFYPHFFIYFHEAFEQFFDDAGIAYHQLINARRVAFPTVHIESDFKAPLQYGDRLEIEITVPKIGTKSAVFRYRGYRHGDGMHAVTAEITTVCVDMTGFSSIDIPPDIRALFERFSA